MGYLVLGNRLSFLQGIPILISQPSSCSGGSLMPKGLYTRLMESREQLDTEGIYCVGLASFLFTSFKSAFRPLAEADG